MISMKSSINLLAIITFVSFLVITGCISESSNAGTYVSVDDPSDIIVLNSDGTINFSNSAGNFTGTYTIKDKNLNICANDGEGSISCISTQIDANGSFPIGFTSYRK